MFNQPNGFKHFYGIVTNVNEIHVYLDSSWPRKWRVRGLKGDYGLADDRDRAVSIAISAKVTSLFDAKIYVHSGFDELKNSRFIITKVKGVKPSSQLFQDYVE